MTTTYQPGTTYVLVAGATYAATQLVGGGWTVKVGDTTVVAATLNRALVATANVLAGHTAVAA